MFDPLRATIRTILEHPVDFDWTVQGFGMMRTYFGTDKKYRLNIWDSALAVPHVSVIHDHPWDFTSWVIAGRFVNTRYVDATVDTSLQYNIHDHYDWQVIKTGEGGGPDGERGESFLRPVSWPETYCPGDSYRQDAREIHESSYADGSVTLNDRVKRLDGEHARVWWPHGEAWVDAEPRVATLNEVKRTTERALEVMERDAAAEVDRLRGKA